MALKKEMILSLLFLTVGSGIGCRALDDPEVESKSIQEVTREGNWSNWGATFTSLNVWGVPVVGPHQKERMHYIGRKVLHMQPDLALFQEAWLEGTGKDINRMARKRHRMHFKRGGVAGSGVLYLTDKPIKKKEFKPFKLFGDWKKPAYYTSKGVGMITTEIHGLTVSVFNTHLMAKFNDRNGPRDKFTPEWKMELFEVMAHVIEQTDTDAFIIVGDFNINMNDEEYWFWKRLSNLDGTYWEEESGVCTSCSDNTYRKGKKNNGQLDYVFISPRIYFRDVFMDYTETYYIEGERRHLSDHYGISGEIGVNSEYGGRESEVRSNFMDALWELHDELTTYRDAMRLQLYQKDGPDFPLEDRLDYSIDYVEEYLIAMGSEQKVSARVQNIRNRLEQYFRIFR